MAPGMRPHSPSDALMAPFRETQTSLPQCLSLAEKLWWQLIRCSSSTVTSAPVADDIHRWNWPMTRSIIFSRLARA